MIIASDAIKKNLETIQKNMLLAAEKSNRSVQTIELMAVTKTKPAEVIHCLIDLGLKCFGENYPDETAEKRTAFEQEGIRLAMIGHLQSRKARIVSQIFDEYHSLDRLDIALKINQLCASCGRRLPVLIECNVGDEESKSGWHFVDDAIPDSFLSDFEKISALSNLDVQGLMILPPFTEEAEVNRHFFIRTRKIAEYLNNQMQAHLTRLSMGTSIDYMVAIEEGASIIRIGTALAGPRDYTK